MQKDNHSRSINTSKSAYSLRWTRALLVLAPVFFVIDQWCKWRILNTEDATQGAFAGIERLHNTHLFIWIPVPEWLLLILTSVVFFAALVVWVYTYHSRSSMQSAALAFILWGGASNLIDRIRFGATVDYLRIISVVANIADFLIIAGILMLILWPHTSSNSEATSDLHTKSS
jgi:lipoprotein signal peptidase